MPWSMGITFIVSAPVFTQAGRSRILANVMDTIQPIGKAYPADRDGYLPRVGNAPEPPWSDVAAQIAGDVERTIGDNLCSVALRGSVTRGTAVAGVSDVDVVLITARKLKTVPRRWVDGLSNPKIDVVVVTEEALRASERCAWLRFSLAFSGWTIWGQDMISELPDPKLGSEAIAHLHSIGAWQQKWRSLIEQNSDRHYRERVCSWLMKRLVRTAFESVMLKENAYARDIYPCVTIATRHNPDFQSALVSAAELSIAPTADTDRIADIERELMDLLAAGYQDNYGQPAPITIFR